MNQKFYTFVKFPPKKNYLGDSRGSLGWWSLSVLACHFPSPCVCAKVEVEEHFLTLIKKKPTFLDDFTVTKIVKTQKWLCTLDTGSGTLADKHPYCQYLSLIFTIGLDERYGLDSECDVHWDKPFVKGS